MGPPACSLQLRDYLTPDSLLLGPLLKEWLGSSQSEHPLSLSVTFPCPCLSLSPRIPLGHLLPGPAVAFDLVSLLPAPSSAHLLSLLQPDISFSNTDLSPSLLYFKTPHWLLSALRTDEAQTLGLLKLFVICSLVISPAASLPSPQLPSSKLQLNRPQFLVSAQLSCACVHPAALFSPSLCLLTPAHPISFSIDIAFFSLTSIPDSIKGSASLELPLLMSLPH